MAPLMRSIFLSMLLCAAAGIGYWKWSHDAQQRTIDELKLAQAQMEWQLAQRQAMIDRLGRSRRIAHVQVTDQTVDPAGRVQQTQLQFIELNDQGAELARQSFTIPGDVLFIDSWTVKFDAERVAEGHPMMGRTLVLLRRIYSDQLAPKDGTPIDTPGAIPPGYAASDVGAFEKRIWENFWEIATDPDACMRMGVRVAQGEAVYKPVKAGQTYELIVDAVGGTSLMPLAKDDAALTSASG